MMLLGRAIQIFPPAAHQPVGRAASTPVLDVHAIDAHPTAPDGPPSLVKLLKEFEAKGFSPKDALKLAFKQLIKELEAQGFSPQEALKLAVQQMDQLRSQETSEADAVDARESAANQQNQQLEAAARRGQETIDAISHL